MQFKVIHYRSGKRKPLFYTTE
ncbi:Protein of unknown function [Lactobacillus helveticus CIRM-BIA 101]|nr:Protein of unknown function [Lactobacillus helveticus CIRM-BIA 101]